MFESHRPDHPSLFPEVTLNKRAVVTGASGHLGFHIARAALQSGFEVELLIRRLNSNVQRLITAGARYQIVDFSNRATLLPALQRADVLFHAAAINTTEADDPESVLAGTAGLAEGTLQAALTARVPLIIYTSSAVVLGRSDSPHHLLSDQDRAGTFESPYVQGKARAEQLCERLIAEESVDLRRLYPSWLIGSGDLRGTPPHTLIRNFLRKGQRFSFAGGISVAAVEEVAKAHVAAALRGERNGTYVVAGDNITFDQLFTDLAQLSGRQSPSLHLPKGAMMAAASALDAVLTSIGKHSPIAPAYIKSVVGSYSWYDSSKAIAQLGYRIKPAREVLADGILAERRRAAGTNALFEKPSAFAIHSDSRYEAPPLLLTGVPGWLGNRFVDILLNGDRFGRHYATREVRILVEPRQKALLELPDRFKIFAADLTDPGSLEAAVSGVGTVVHLAGAIYPKRIGTLYRVNTDGTQHLVDACIKAGVRRFLYMSTDSVCGYGAGSARIFDENTPDRPYRHYGRSKWLAEQYILEKSQAGLLDGTILRGFWFFGPFAPERQERFLAMMRKNRQLVFGSGKNYRSISHTDNTVSAFLAAENASATVGKSYWIGDERADYTVDDIYRLLCDAVGQTYRPIYIPALACRLAQMVDALMARAGLLHPTVHALGKFDLDIAGRIDAARRDFGYQPVTSLPEFAGELAQRGMFPPIAQGAQAG